MPQEYIEIRGARENNLRNVSLRIPKRKITIFTGVSGSGKSSIVFDTIATEAQRLLTAHGLYRGPISRTNGPQTQAAVRAFQRAQGLPEAGVVTASLVNLMRATL